MEEKNKRRVVKYLLFTGLVLILMAIALVMAEVFEAKKFCKDVGEEFEIDWLQLQYYCGGEPIYNYDSGFGFDKEPKINYSKLK